MSIKYFSTLAPTDLASNFVPKVSACLVSSLIGWLNGWHSNLPISLDKHSNLWVYVLWRGIDDDDDDDDDGGWEGSVGIELTNP